MDKERIETIFKRFADEIEKFTSIQETEKNMKELKITPPEGYEDKIWKQMN